MGDTEGAIAVMYNRVVSMHEMMKQCLGIFDVKKELANRGVVIEQKNDFEGAEFLGPALKFM